jgi:hypothetical protein
MAVSRDRRNKVRGRGHVHPWMDTGGSLGDTILMIDSGLVGRNGFLYSHTKERILKRNWGYEPSGGKRSQKAHNLKVREEWKPARTSA